MNKSNILTGEWIVLKRMVVIACVIGAPVLWWLGRLSVVNVALTIAGLMLASNVLVGLVLWRRPGMAAMISTGTQMSNEDAREMAEGMLGVDNDE